MSKAVEAGRWASGLLRRLSDAARVARIYWLFLRLERQYPYSRDLGGPKLVLLPSGAGQVALVGERGATFVAPLLEWETPREGVGRLWTEVETGTPASRRERGWTLAERSPENRDEPAPGALEAGMKPAAVIHPATPYPHGDLAIQVLKSDSVVRND